MTDQQARDTIERLMRRNQVLQVKLSEVRRRRDFWRKLARLHGVKVPRKQPVSR